MLDVTVKTTKLDLSLDLPDRKFWQVVALEAEKDIKKRTLSGQDVEGKAFKPYSKDYAKYRKEHGRTQRPNLVYSGIMQSAIRGTAKSDHAKLAITGTEGMKAWENERMGRNWFDLSGTQVDAIVKKATAWMKRKNDLK